MTAETDVDPDNIVGRRPNKRTAGKATAKETTISTSTPTTGEHAIQISSKLNGDLVNVRANSAEELEELLDGLAERSGPIAEKWSNFKQAGVAAIIFTNDDNRGGRSSSKSTSTATDSAPDGPPTCKHGEMKDLGDKYRSGRWHCPLDTRDLGPDGWKQKCKPIK